MNDALASALAAAGFDGAAGRTRLALAIGVDSVTVWRWIRGKSSPGSDATYTALARELRRTPDEIRAMFDREDVAA